MNIWLKYFKNYILNLSINYYTGGMGFGYNIILVSEENSEGISDSNSFSEKFGTGLVMGTDFNVMGVNMKTQGKIGIIGGFSFKEQIMITKTRTKTFSSETKINNFFEPFSYRWSINFMIQKVSDNEISIVNLGIDNVYYGNTMSLRGFGFR
jgi:hypothetical protein